MYCPSCGKQMEDDAQFCPHCGEDVDASDDAPQEQPAAAAPPPAAPAAPAPQPTSSAVPPAQPTPTPAPTPPPTAAQPAPPPAAAPTQPVAPPPTTLPPAPAPTAGEPAKKGTSCWLIGCIVLAVVVILGGIGTCIATKYAVKKGTEAIEQSGGVIEGLENLQEQLEEGGIVINEGDDDEGSTTTTTTTSVSSDAPAAVTSLVRTMFAAWARGDEGGVISRMGPTLREALEGEDTFDTKYTQISVEFVEEEKQSDTQWSFTVKETYDMGDGEVKTAIYLLDVSELSGGWKVTNMEKLDD